jgi:hypothetical protein
MIAVIGLQARQAMRQDRIDVSAPLTIDVTGAGSLVVARAKMRNPMRAGPVTGRKLEHLGSPKRGVRLARDASHVSHVLGKPARPASLGIRKSLKSHKTRVNLS